MSDLGGDTPIVRNMESSSVKRSGRLPGLGHDGIEHNEWDSLGPMYSRISFLVTYFGNILT